MFNFITHSLFFNECYEIWKASLRINDECFSANLEGKHAFFFSLFNYRFKLYKLPTDPFSSVECNFIGFFFLFLATCYLNFPFFFQFIEWSFLRLLYWLDFVFVWQIYVRFALFFICLYVLSITVECRFIDDFSQNEIMVSLELFTAFF